MERVILAVKATAVLVGILLAIGLGIGSSKGMPDYAQVYIDDAKRTYLAPPCLKIIAGLRAVTAGEARRLGYSPDRKCRKEGAFIQDDRSFTGMLLQEVGILKPIPSRWNEDGSWNY